MALSRRQMMDGIAEIQRVWREALAVLLSKSRGPFSVRRAHVFLVVACFTPLSSPPLPPPSSSLTVASFAGVQKAFDCVARRDGGRGRVQRPGESERERERERERGGQAGGGRLGTLGRKITSR